MTLGLQTGIRLRARRPVAALLSLVVESRAPPPKLVEMQIYRAGRKSPIECSSVLYETVEAANRAGKEALKQLLTEFPA
jgi:hypothetical protein